MAKVTLHKLFKSFRGKIQGLVFRKSHNGETSVYAGPDMTHVKWSAAQIAHREHMAEASAYATAATADPQVRPFYERMSMETKGNNRPYDMAVKHYFAGYNLLGERFHWDAELWRAKMRDRKRKQR